MRPMLYDKLQVNVSRRVTEETPGGGVTHKSVPNGVLIGDVYVEVDERLLRDMALKALRAKSKRAVVGNGLIVAKARNVRHEGGADS